MIVQSASLDITMSLDDTEEYGSLASSKEPDIFSELDIEQSDTMDKSNSATYASKQTYLSSIPGTIYYNGLDSVTEPHIQNARKVSVDSVSQLFAENPPPQKIRPIPQQNNLGNSSVPQMQWTPPKPVSANCQHTQSSKPKYDAQPYNSSVMDENIVPAIPVEELSVDGFTDTVLKRQVVKICCGNGGKREKMKGQKALLMLSAVVIVLAIFAVAFSIAYAAGADKEDRNEVNIPKYCHSDCYDPLRPGLICKCDCYTKEDDKYYTCSSQTEVYYPKSYNQTDNGVDNKGDNEVDNDDDVTSIFEGLNGTSSDDGNTSLFYSANDNDDDDHEDRTNNIDYDDSFNDKDCGSMCYRQNIHRGWNPSDCNPSCYDNNNQYDQRYRLWMEWHIDVTP